MPYTKKNTFGQSLTKNDIRSAIAAQQPDKFERAQKSSATKDDLVRLARRDTLKQAYQKKTILKTVEQILKN